MQLYWSAKRFFFPKINAQIHYILFLKKISESKVQGGLVRASIIHYNLRLVEKMTTEKIMLEHKKHNREKQLFPHRNRKDNGTWDMKQEDTFENPSCNKECWNLALFFMSMFKRQQGFTLQYLSQTRHPSYQSPFRIRMLYHDIWQEEDPSLPCTTMHRCPFEIL